MVLAKPLRPATYEVRVKRNRVTQRAANIQLGVSETLEVILDFIPKEPDPPYIY